jgi:hypothetical protein
MPKFAVYYVPDADDPFYRLGTALLGYDVRAGTSTDLPPDLLEYFGQYGGDWTVISRPYGFHLTITEAIDCSWATIPRVERELADLIGCFDPSHPFTLRRREGNPVGIWGEAGRNSLVLLYEPNEYLRMLHTLLVARINPLGTGSGFLRRYLAHPEHEALPHLAQQTKLFYSPKLFDSWYPHFTVLNPYTGGEPARMASLLAHLFESYEHLTMQTICLLIQVESEANWQIYREFHRPSPTVPAQV